MMDEQMAGERERLHRLLVSARERAPVPKTRRECAVLLRGEDCMWTFLEVEGMPPTNNLAERCLRRAVLGRKESFGTDSEAGSRFVERILTVTTTLQQQHRPVLDFLVDVRIAHLRAEPLPSLTPSP